MIYYEHPKLHNAYGKVLMAVKKCSKAVFGIRLRHGKSPCFSEVSFLQLVSPDYPLSILSSVNGLKFLKCAF